MEATNGLVLAGAPELPARYFYRVDQNPWDGMWRVQIRQKTWLGFSRFVAECDARYYGDRTISTLVWAAEVAYMCWQAPLLVGDYT